MISSLSVSSRDLGSSRLLEQLSTPISNTVKLPVTYPTSLPLDAHVLYEVSEGLCCDVQGASSMHSWLVCHMLKDVYKRSFHEHGVHYTVSDR